MQAEDAIREYDMVVLHFFFFQAEDGIRDVAVTGVQTCALPISCTPAGCVEILDHYGCDLKGAEAVVIGRSRLVGKPLAQLLLARHATVTMCHTRDRKSVV